MLAIYRRDLKRLFTGMVAPIFIAFFAFMCGYFTVSHLRYNVPQFERSIPSIGFIFLLIVPILTMNSFASEKAEKTDAALYSLPLPTLSVVVGKYLSMVTVLAVSTLFMPIGAQILSGYGDVYFPTIFASIFAFFLMGCALISIGMFISTLTESKDIAHSLSTVILLVIYLLGSFISNIPTSSTASFVILLFAALALFFEVWVLTKNFNVSVIVGVVLIAADVILYNVKKDLFDSLVPRILEQFCVFDKLNNFVYGVFDWKAVVYYLSVIFMFGFFTVLSFDKKRWN